MCRNGRYTESGIKHLHGFCAERFRIMPQYAVPIASHLQRVGVLVEPASVVAKAWEHIERIGRRAHWAPQRVLVTGAGPVGLLAALMGIQRGFAVNVLDRITHGPKPSLEQDLGARYHTSDIREACSDADIVLECTGVGQLVFEVVQGTPPGGIVCLTGLSSGGRLLEVNLAELNRRMVLENDVVFGSVNANRRHYEAAVGALARADLSWLERLITRRVALPHWQEALTHEPTDVKVILDWTL
jgi:threonine dehydrogenase-like Zn-dependent dehydrogenase